MKNKSSRGKVNGKSCRRWHQDKKNFFLNIKKKGKSLPSPLLHTKKTRTHLASLLEALVQFIYPVVRLTKVRRMPPGNRKRSTVKKEVYITIMTKQYLLITKKKKLLTNEIETETTRVHTRESSSGFFGQTWLII